MYVVDVDDPGYPGQVHSLAQQVKDIHMSSGAYGAKARRLVREGRIDVHHPFHALENALLAVSLGGDYVLYTDTSLLPLVGINLARVEQKVGLRINVLFCGHLQTHGSADPNAAKVTEKPAANGSGSE